MKVKIQHRQVYHKYAEIEVEVDKVDYESYLKINKHGDLQDYLITNQGNYIAEIDDKLQASRFHYGFGTDHDANLHYGSAMCDNHLEEEWRYECEDLQEGGHL